MRCPWNPSRSLDRTMRPATTIVLGLLLLLIFGAALFQFLVQAR